MEFLGLVLWLVLSFAAAGYAGSKGRSTVGFFFLSIFLSPLIAFIWIAVSPSDPQSMGLRKCPQCAEWVKAEALKCRFCSFNFVAPVTSAIPAAAPVAAASVEPLASQVASEEVAAEPSLKWMVIAGACAVLALILMWSFQSVQGARADEESAVASVRTLATACLVYESSLSHGYPARLSFLGPSSSGLAEDDFGFGLIDAALASGTKQGYVFEYTAGQQVRGKITGFRVIARPVSGDRRSFYVDETAVIRYSTSGDPDKHSKRL